MSQKTRYTDVELQEFKSLIEEKIVKAKSDLDLLKSAYMNDGNNGTEDTAPTFKAFEEGSETMSKEANTQLAIRQEKFIRDLKNALIRIENKNLSNDEALELAINSGANECESSNKYHEIISEMKDFYKVKSKIENKISNFIYSGIEWRAHNVLKLSKEQKEKVVIMLESLDEIDDIQNIFINCEF